MAAEVFTTNQFDAIPDANLDQVQEQLEKLVSIAEPVNGPNSFNLETAAYGYITRDERLVIPSAFRNRISQNISQAPNFNVVELMAITLANYIRLKRTNLSDDHALFLAVYRSRLVHMGYLLREKEDRHVTVDEVDYLDSARDYHGPDYDAIREYKEAFDAEPTEVGKLLAYLNHGSSAGFKKFIQFALTKTEIFRFLTLAANQLAASTYLVFRQMGHHYKPELEQKYNTLWRATTLEIPTFMPSNGAIHRVAIHSFGMYSLHEKFFYNREERRLAETYMDRADVTPCGVAIINTCWASISLMKSLPIWPSLYRAYQTQIDDLERQANKLRDAKEAIKYHKNAKLFGVNKSTLDPTSAYAMAPVAKGFLESMDETADIKRQKTLDKRASQNPVAVQLVQNVILNVLNRVVESADLARALPAPGPSNATNENDT